MKLLLRSWTLLIPVEVVEEENPFQSFFVRLILRIFGPKRRYMRLRVVANTPEEAVQRVEQVITTFSSRNLFSVDANTEDT